MESIIQTSAVPSAPQTTLQPDQRPTADAAALASNPQPPVPLPVPASIGPVASVNQSRIVKTESTDTAITELERTLKPYGVNMLPHDPPTSAIKAADKGTTSPP